MIRPRKNTILITNLEKGDRYTSSGIWLPDDNATERGIRPRWAQIYAIGEGIQEKHDLNVGDWVLLDHGHWSRIVEVEDSDGKVEIQMVDEDVLNRGLLGKSDEKPEKVTEFDGTN